ncbi:hypothetical protein [Rhodococcus sp. KRD197]|uniref:hypothetical protein n=1 Tax=Rhodococcus sp. KRD197 TaxID=2729731 RepID=UPI0019D2DB09|nr:hypothetical protein [Rhodococcus sp. KRD197]
MFRKYLDHTSFEARLIGLRYQLDIVDPELFSLTSSDSAVISRTDRWPNASLCRNIFGDVVGPRICRLSLEWDGNTKNTWPRLLHRAVDPSSAYNQHTIEGGLLDRRVAHALACALPAYMHHELAQLPLRGSHILLWRGLGNDAGSHDTFFADAARRRPHDYSAPPLSSYTTSVVDGMGWARDGHGILLVELVPFGALFSAEYILGELGEIVVRDHKHRWLLPLRLRDQTWHVDYPSLDNRG